MGDGRIGSSPSPLPPRSAPAAPVLPRPVVSPLPQPVVPRRDSGFDLPTPARVALPSTTDAPVGPQMRNLSQTLEAFPNPLPAGFPGDLGRLVSTARAAMEQGNEREAVNAFRGVRYNGVWELPAAQQTAVRQLLVVSSMTERLDRVPSVPPSAADLTAYGQSFARAPAGEAAAAFAAYAGAFNAHADLLHLPDVRYADGARAADVMPPSVGVSNDGRAIQDCQGYAILGEAFFQAAGFRTEFASGYASRAASAAGHFTLWAQRGREAVVVSNWNAVEVPRGANRDQVVRDRIQTDARITVPEGDRLYRTPHFRNVTTAD